MPFLTAVAPARPRPTQTSLGQWLLAGSCPLCPSPPCPHCHGEELGCTCLGQGRPGAPDSRLLTGFLQVSPACSWKAFPTCPHTLWQELWESLSSVPAPRASAHGQGDHRPHCPLGPGPSEGPGLTASPQGWSSQSKVSDEGSRASASPLPPGSRRLWGDWLPLRFVAS